jgi:hypothetical protein
VTYTVTAPNGRQHRVRADHPAHAAARVYGSEPATRWAWTEHARATVSHTPLGDYRVEPGTREPMPKNDHRRPGGQGRR